MTPIKRHKPKVSRKEALIKARVTAAEKVELQKAARAAGMDLSNWLRHVALKAAGNT